MLISSHEHHPGSRAPMQANLTPLIDVTFLLIVFFVLVAQINNSQIVTEINLPEPQQSVSEEPEQDEDSRLIINAIPAPDDPARVVAYRLGSRDYPANATGLARLAEELRSARQDRANLIVDLRADRATPYGMVHPAMRAAASVGIHRINLIVQPSRNRGDDP
jgi:biopolymer transport protein ExbD